MVRAAGGVFHLYEVGARVLRFDHLVDSTISYWNRCARRFLIWYSATGRPLRGLEVVDFHHYIAHLAAERDDRRSISNVVKALRSLVRFAGDQGWCRKHLAESIVGPRVYSDESLPMGPPWPDVERLIKSVYTDRARACYELCVSSRAKLASMRMAKAR